MTVVLYWVLGALLFWYVCGIVNVAGVQAFSPTNYKDFNEYNRSSTLGICFGVGPAFTLFGIGYLIFRFGMYKPIQWGTRIGRAVGRKFEQD